jgi:hypothetical protein
MEVHMKTLKIYYLILLSWLFCLPIFAQGNDTSVFFRYAATFDYLLPVAGEPYTLAIPDSIAEEVFNADLKNAKLHKLVKLHTVTEKSTSTINLHEERMFWDGEGRLTRHAFYIPEDDQSIRDTRIEYVSGKKISSITLRNEHENIAPDTLKYTYNRSGWINSWRRHVVDITNDAVTTGNRLYDSRGRLIVATYMMYGPLLGAYTYEYNDRNQLTRRCFTTASGAILCTDSIAYSDLQTVLLVTHWLKIAGSDKWTTLEVKTVYTHSGNILGYTDYNDADTSYFYRNLPSYSVIYEYDDKGRIISENFGNEIIPTIISAKYEYGKYDQPDYIEYAERVDAKKSFIMRPYSQDERRYDEQGRITSREITTLLYEEMSRKSTFVPKEIVEIRYQWQ